MHGRTSVLPFAILALVARIASLSPPVLYSRIVRGKPVHDNSDCAALQAQGRPRSVSWLILCGVALIGAIAIGTALTVDHFRERAMADSARELGNTALLLARYLDQQLDQLALAQTNLIEQMGPDHTYPFSSADRAEYAENPRLIKGMMRRTGKVIGATYLSEISRISQGSPDLWG